MEEPQLSSYGLNSSEFERWRHIDEDVAPRFAACFLGLGFVAGAVVGLVMGGVSLVTPIAVLMFGVLGLAYSFFPVLIV
jgi:hypothetical protein